MNVAAYALCLALSQAPEGPPPTDPAPAATPAAEEPVAPPVAPTGPARPKGMDEVNRLLSKLPSMKPEARAAALEALAKQFGQVDSSPVLPASDIDLDKYLGLPPAAQVQVVARGFFLDLIAGETGKVLARSGYPFFMEAKRIDRPEELRAQWGKSLRSRRTDLLKLYSVEVFLPADVEKKYGRPPARLSSWNWRAPNTYVAIGNLSGHATVLLLRQAGAAWQVVGFHD